MDKIEDELMEDDKEFLDKMFGDRAFLENPEAKKYQPAPDDDVDGLASYILLGPGGWNSDECRLGFLLPWRRGTDPFDLASLHGFIDMLLEKALREGDQSGLEGKLYALLQEFHEQFRDSCWMDHYLFAQCLALAYRQAQRKEPGGYRPYDNEDTPFHLRSRLIHIEEESLKFMIKCAEYVKNLLRVFTFDVNNTLAQYISEPEWKTKAECYKHYYQDGDKQKIIAADLGISQSSVAKYIDEVQGRLSFEMGQAYEDFFEKNIASRKYDRYIRMGGKGEPDGIGYRGDSIEVVNLKCHQQSRNSDTIHRSGLRAEIEYAKRLIQEGNKNVKAMLVYHEFSRNLDFEKDIDIDDEAQKITLNFEA